MLTLYSCYIKTHGALISYKCKIFQLCNYNTKHLSILHYHYTYKTGKEYQQGLPHMQDWCECPKVICIQDQILYVLIEVWVVIPVIIDHAFMSPSGFYIL